MSAAVAEVVRPAGSRHEGVLLLALALAVIAVLGLRVASPGRGEVAAPLHAWQISAFDGLAGADQAIFNALHTAKDDIPYIYDDINLMNAPGEVFRWPAIQDLDDWLLPPFHRDRSWEQNGSLQWSLHEPLAQGEMQGSVMYLGTGGSLPDQGSFLVVIGHVHAGFTNNNQLAVWWNPENQVQMPGSGFQDGLILQGWRQVVPHDGRQEVRRLFGDEALATPVEDDRQVAEELIDDLFGE